MTYILHRFAERDLEEAFLFYRKTGSGRVALRFLAEFERVAELLDESPGIGTPTHGNRRTFPFHKYPYWLIYRPIDTSIRILVVRHERRHVEYGAERT